MSIYNDHQILSVQTVTASTGSAEISLPALWDQTRANAGAWGQGHQISGSEYFSTDKVRYEFSNVTGSIVLAQSSTDTDGIKLYPDSNGQAKSGPWRLIAGPPRYLYNSGSNSDDIHVVTILVR